MIKEAKTIEQRLAALEAKLNLVLGVLIGVGLLNAKQLLNLEYIPPAIMLFFNSLF